MKEKTKTPRKRYKPGEYNHLGENMKMILDDKGISVEEAAKLANISKTTLTGLIEGKSINPSVKTIMSLSDAFGIYDLDRFVRGNMRKSDFDSTHRKTGRQASDKHPSNYTDEQKKEVLSMYSRGCSNIEIAAYLGVTGERLNDFCNPKNRIYNFEFHQLVEFGRTQAQAWWTREGREALRDKDFNTALWKAFMASKFGWSDKHEVRETDSFSLDDEIFSSFKRSE